MKNTLPTERPICVFPARFLCQAVLAVLLLTGGACPGAPVSFHRDLEPVLREKCLGCHKPGKAKGELDLATHAGLMKGGKHGPSVSPGNPKGSRLIEEISGNEPSMPKEGTPLTKMQVSLIERWIKEGANNDTPAESGPRFSKTNPPEYHSQPPITAMAYSPDGEFLAIAGRHEILLQPTDGSDIVDRMIGDSPRIESLTFSKNGALLAAAGGAPGRFGELQIWDMATKKRVHSLKPSTDCLLGVSFSADVRSVAAGGVDRIARVWSLPSGAERFQFSTHSDWCTGTGFSMDGKYFITTSRDKSVKLLNAETGALVDDLVKTQEPILVAAVKPGENAMACAGEAGGLRLYKVEDAKGATTLGKDVNLIREFEKQPWAVTTTAFSSDGQWLAAAGAGAEARVYKTADGTKAAVLKGHTGALYSLAWLPGGASIATAGFDGVVRVYEIPSGVLLTSFKPRPPAPRQAGR